ncbi:glycosyltransferase family 2 protein [Chitinilyticum litopenaei]|uniref:glycosyltransferase family 2 protein n=1 Tax=Chitinilyticum litopenaei TaxID=1121276 RepID=UPI0009DB828B|nr:glycosyltransferase family 2 protein [Chitinilyticum litopenaei]
MVNILIPLAGKSLFFPEDEYFYPLPLIEIHGKPIIELVVNNLRDLHKDSQFIFIVQREDCQRFHLDRTLSLITSNAKIIRSEGITKGAACSCLLAVDHINNEDELIIANGDQLFLSGIEEFIPTFRGAKADAGCVYFNSVLPRWSYLRLDGHTITEAVEKKPISRNAIAGLYYFKNGRDFVKASMNTIFKNASVNDSYYIAPTINELILDGKRTYATPIKNEHYFTFYTPQKIQDYESLLAGNKQ